VKQRIILKLLSIIIKLNANSKPGTHKSPNPPINESPLNVVAQTNTNSAHPGLPAYTFAFFGGK
jgi:hypothetical protein